MRWHETRRKRKAKELRLKNNCCTLIELTIIIMRIKKGRKGKRREDKQKEGRKRKRKKERKCKGKKEKKAGKGRKETKGRKRNRK